MARAKKIGTFGKIIVRSVESGEILNLHFTNESIFDTTRWALRRNKKVEIVDAFYGYSLYNDADMALSEIEMYFGK